MHYLVDTGVLLRLFDRSSPEYPAIIQLVTLLRREGHSLMASPQNIAEFWNVSTRPASARGGFAQSAASTELRVRYLERIGSILPEPPEVYRVWRKLAEEYGLIGVAVHDARLVAIMHVASIKTITTLNAKDFRRYREIEAVTPQEFLVRHGKDANWR